MTIEMTRRRWLRMGALAAAGVAARPALALAPARGQAEAKAVPAATGPIRLHYNENPLGPSAAARRAIEAALGEGGRYPTDAHRELKNAIAEHEGLSPAHVVLGAGSHEILRMIAMAYGLEGGEIVTGHPTYEGLENYATTIGATIHRVPLDGSFGLDLERMERRATPAVGLVYVCNPNNPTGTLLPSARLRSFCEEVSRRSVVLVDEAYHELVEAPGYASMAPLVAKGADVIVSRTFSKVYGLAGLRVGYGLARPEIAERLRRFRTSSGVNVLGLRAALASYGDRDFLATSRRKNAEARDYAVEVIQEAGYRCLPSHTNFVFFHLRKNVDGFRRQMEERGILVGRPFPPMTDWCRLSLGTMEEMRTFAKVFRSMAEA